MSKSNDEYRFGDLGETLVEKSHRLATVRLEKLREQDDAWKADVEKRMPLLAVLPPPKAAEIAETAARVRRYQTLLGTRH